MVELSEALQGFDKMDQLTALGVTDSNDLANRFLEANKTISSTQRAPVKDASTQDWGEFWNANGRPAEAETYKVPDTGGAPLKEVLAGIRPDAHAAGLTEAQWNAVTGAASAKSSAQQEALTQQIGATREQWRAEVKAQYGDQADARIAQAQRTFDTWKANDPRLANILEATGLGDHPYLIDLMVKAGDFYGDDKVPTNTGTVNQVAGSPQQEMQKFANLAAEGRSLAMNDAFMDRKSPEHEATLNNWWAIQKDLQVAGFSGCTDARLQSVNPAVNWGQEFAKEIEQHGRGQFAPPAAIRSPGPQPRRSVNPLTGL